MMITEVVITSSERLYIFVFDERRYQLWTSGTSIIDNYQPVPKRLSNGKW